MILTRMEFPPSRPFDGRANAKAAPAGLRMAFDFEYK